MVITSAPCSILWMIAKDTENESCSLSLHDRRGASMLAATKLKTSRKTILKVNSFNSMDAISHGSKGDLVKASRTDGQVPTRYQINFYQSVPVEAIQKSANVGVRPHIHTSLLDSGRNADLYPSIIRNLKSPFLKRSF